MFKPPSTPKPTLPSALDGKVFENVGKYARGAILFAFERIGGAEALSDWAEDNKGEFYTKLFPKIVTREVEVTERRSLDDLMDVIDAKYDEMPPADTPPTPEHHRFERLEPVDDEAVADLPSGDDWDIDDMVEFDDV